MMATNRDVPSIGAALSALARLTLVRLLRGKLLWVSIAIACLPILLAKAVGQQPATALQTTFGIELFVLAILPPLFAAPAIGEELEDRTATYLWSRPLPRWSILAGKLLALAPFVMAILVASWIAAIIAALHTAPPALTIVALAAGTLAVSIVSAGIATIAPKRGMAFAIIYILVIDLSLGAIPASIQWLSVTHATSTLAGLEPGSSPVSGAIAMAILSAVWLAVAFRRIGRIET
jgi:ABC-type transport system involved in multi-copper enzyme maturation permease subunit